MKLFVLLTCLIIATGCTSKSPDTDSEVWHGQSVKGFYRTIHFSVPENSLFPNQAQLALTGHLHGIIRSNYIDEASNKCKVTGEWSFKAFNKKTTKKTIDINVNLETEYVGKPKDGASLSISEILNIVESSINSKNLSNKSFNRKF